MKYQVINIQEDLDYGCEEREVVLAVVTLQDENGNEIVRKDPDQELYDKKIDKGSTVIIDEIINYSRLLMMTGPKTVIRPMWIYQNLQI